jgi:hypothetical protein
MFLNRPRPSPSESIPSYLSIFHDHDFIRRYVNSIVGTKSLVYLGFKRLIESNRGSLTVNVRDAWQEQHCRPVPNTPRPFLINEIFWLHAGRAVTPVAGMTLHHAVPTQALCLGRLVLTLQIHKNCTIAARKLGVPKASFHFHCIDYNPRF